MIFTIVNLRISFIPVNNTLIDLSLHLKDLDTT